VDLLRAFANQAANALHNAELYESLRLEQERIIRAQEEVRHHLARDLHDNTAQMLSLIIMNIDLLRQQVQNGRTARLLPDLESLEKIARQTNREVRTLLFELRPIILETRGLVPALISYHRQLEQSMECTLHLDVEELPVQIELTAASAIFSVMQEAVNNIRKHAQAQNIWMRVRCVDNTLHFVVEDDGRGFDIDRVLTSYDERGSMGLLDMHERVSMLNGRLTVTSPRIGHGTGTMVSGQLPLDRLRQAGSESASAKSVFGAFVNI
jgi:signal transduction histidine kinase